MQIVDQHVHSFLSCDSEESIEAYIEKAKVAGDTILVTTEHMDLRCCLFGKDIVPDYELQMETIKILEQKHEVEIRMGVEFGYKPGIEGETEDMLQTYPFDLVLMSIHEDEVADVSTKGFMLDLSPSEANRKYLDLYIRAIKSYHNYDVLAHLDYLLRYIEVIDLSEHKQQLVEIFEHIIKEGKALEFNTRFLYRHKYEEYLIYMFDLYKSCGGTKVSLGSDCHTAVDFKGEFTRAIEILKSLGFTHLSQFKKRKEYQVPL